MTRTKLFEIITDGKVDISAEYQRLCFENHMKHFNHVVHYNQHKKILI